MTTQDRNRARPAVLILAGVATVTAALMSAAAFGVISPATMDALLAVAALAGGGAGWSVGR